MTTFLSTIANATTTTINGNGNGNGKKSSDYRFENDENNDVYFYEELKKWKESLSKDVCMLKNDKKEELCVSIPTNMDISYCLISHEPLTKDFIKLLCNHSFNYIPLMKDLFGETKKRSKNACYSLRCPYCRTVQLESLPYIKKYGIPYMRGVHISKEEIAKQKAEEVRQKELVKAQKVEEKHQKELVKAQKAEEKLKKKIVKSL